MLIGKVKIDYEEDEGCTFTEITIYTHGSMVDNFHTLSLIGKIL